MNSRAICSHGEPAADCAKCAAECAEMDARRSTIDTKRLREMSRNHACQSMVRPAWAIALEDTAAEIDRLRRREKMVRGLKCHSCAGRGRHYHDGICDCCMGTGLRVPELENDE